MSFDPQEVLQHLQLAEQKLAQLPEYEKALNDANAKLHDAEKAYNQLKKSIDANAKSFNKVLSGSSTPNFPEILPPRADLHRTKITDVVVCRAESKAKAPTG